LELIEIRILVLNLKIETIEYFFLKKYVEKMMILTLGMTLFFLFKLSHVKSCKKNESFVEIVASSGPR